MCKEIIFYLNEKEIRVSADSRVEIFSTEKESDNINLSAEKLYEIVWEYFSMQPFKESLTIEAISSGSTFEKL